MTSTTGIKGIDHAAILVRDLVQAERMYRRLGFKTTPIGRHDNTGTANHCIMFDEDFFEILGILAPTDFNKQWAEAIAEREGLWAMALMTDDVRATYAALKEAGFDPTEPKGFSRPVELPGGPQQARFTLTYPKPDAVPGIRLLVCEHHTRELVWRPEYLGHSNGATGLSHLTLAVDDPRAAAPAYGRLFGTSPVARVGGFEIPAGRATIRLVSPIDASVEFAGDPVLSYRRPVPVCLGFTVADLKDSKAFFDAAGIPATALPKGGYRIGSALACGVALDFI